METIVLIIFVITYAGIALGGIPGLALDRTGVALLGAIHLPSVLIGLLNLNGIDIHNLFVLTMVSALFSNLVSNVPTTMLLTKFLSPSDHIQWYVLALSSTFAGNLITIGSIANLITIEGAKEFGIVISFREHAKIGIPVTVVSLLIALMWIGIFR